MTVSNAQNSGRSISAAITPKINIYTRRSIYSSRRWTRLLLSLMKTEGARQWRLTRVHNAALAWFPGTIRLLCSRRRSGFVTTWARSAFVHENAREIDPLTMYNDFRILEFFFSKEFCSK